MVSIGTADVRALRLDLPFNLMKALHRNRHDSAGFLVLSFGCVDSEIRFERFRARVRLFEVR